MKVLAVGYNAWDVVFPCDDLPERDGKREYPTMVAGGGGPAATAAVALAMLGAEVAYVGVLADDPPGLMQREELRAAGVDLRHAVSAYGASSPLAVSLVDVARAERRICWSRGDLRCLDPVDMEASWLDGVDLFYCDGHECAAALSLAEAAAARGIPRVMDGGTPRDGTEKLVARCSDVVGAAGFATGLTGRSNRLEALRELHRLGPETVGTTHGAAGCVALIGDRPRHIPAFEVPVLDTTGAGDAFHAGFAWARMGGAAVADRCDWGAAVAALACRDFGGRSSLPTKEEVRALLAGGRRRTEVPTGYDF